MTQTRFLLEPLGELANRCGTTILTVKHLNKDEAKTVASRVGGSVAYVNVPRACFVVAADPSDATRRILAPFKWNPNAPMPPSIAWTMAPPPSDCLEAILARCDHLSDEDREKLAGQLHRLTWVGEVEGTADDLLRSAARGVKKSNRDEMEYRRGMATEAVGRRSGRRLDPLCQGGRPGKPGLSLAWS